MMCFLTIVFVCVCFISGVDIMVGWISLSGMGWDHSFTLAIHNETNGGYRFFQCEREISEFPVSYSITFSLVHFLTTP